MTASDIVTDPQLVAVLRAAEQARSQCDQILALITAQRDSEQASELGSQQKKLFSDLAVVRGLNRKAILDVRCTKQDTSDARQEVDTLHLQLQNLYYEQRHLNGEIALCENYEYAFSRHSCHRKSLRIRHSHPYKKLPLLPTDTYLSLHPEHDELDDHELMRERIEHEHAERLQLEEARQTLLKQKQTLIAENNKRKEVLAALDKKLDDWIDGSEVVEKEFGQCEEGMGRVGAGPVKRKEDAMAVAVGT